MLHRPGGELIPESIVVNGAQYLREGNTDMVIKQGCSSKSSLTCTILCGFWMWQDGGVAGAAVADAVESAIIHYLPVVLGSLFKEHNLDISSDIQVYRF